MAAGLRLGPAVLGLYAPTRSAQPFSKELLRGLNTLSTLGLVLFIGAGSFANGALMNARGLMELTARKVGLDSGPIDPETFTILLVMALVTTAMTSPLITLALRLRRAAPTALAA